MQMKHNRAPVQGIFAVEVHGAADKVLQGAASLGVRPTVKVQGEAVLEVYLFDFDEEIYGRHVRVDFLHKLRDEEKYVELETLKRQIAVDVAKCKDYFFIAEARM